MKPTITDPKRAQEYFAARMAFTTGPVELNRWIESKEPVTIIDVRRPEHFAQGHIPGAINLPKEKWAAAPAPLSKDRVSVLYCYSHVCHLAAEAALEFAKQGYPVMELEGGFDVWQKNGLPVSKLETAAAR